MSSDELEQTLKLLGDPAFKWYRGSPYSPVLPGFQTQIYGAHDSEDGVVWGEVGYTDWGKSGHSDGNYKAGLALAIFRDRTLSEFREDQGRLRPPFLDESRRTQVVLFRRVYEPTKTLWRSLPPGELAAIKALVAPVLAKFALEGAEMARLRQMEDARRSVEAENVRKRLLDKLST